MSFTKKTIWQPKKLSEVLKLEYGKPLPKSERGTNGKYPVYGANGIKSWSNKFYYDKPTIIIGRKGSAGEINLTEKKFWPLDVTYFVTFDEKKYDLKFLYNFLITLEIPKLAKGVKPGINRNEVYDIDVEIPPLPEQKRLVALLDGLFEKLEKAKENAAKNLNNAKELFEAYLHSIFENQEADWGKKRFDEVCVLQRGFDLPTRLRKKGDFPLVSSNGITDSIDQWKVKSPGVVTGRSGTIGNVHIIETNYWPLNTALYVKEFHGNDEKFIYYFLKYFDLGKYSSGAGVPTLNRNNVHGEIVCLPKLIPEQKEIVLKLDSLLSDTQKFESIYQQKLSYLTELKKSILHQAFSGKM